MNRDGATDVSDDIRVIPDVEDSRLIDLTETIDEPDAAEPGAGARVGTSARRRYRLVAFVLVVLDALCLAVALLGAHALRFGFLPRWDYIMGIVVAGVLWLGVFHALGLYAPQHLSGLEEFRRTVSAVGIGIVVVILLTFWFDLYLSRSWMALTLIMALVLELTARKIVGVYVSRLRARRSLLLRTLVVGSGEYSDSAELVKALDEPGSGFLALGYIGAPLIAAEEVSPTDRVERLREVFREYEPDCVFVASPSVGTREMVAVMYAARQEGVHVRLYTPLSGILTSRVTVQRVGKGGVALTLRPVPFSRTQSMIKRAFDLSVAGLISLLALPLLAAVAIAIKLTTGGPVLFRQDRVTEGGRVFSMYKFRTMTNGADSHLKPATIDTSVPFFKLKDDPRVTKLGKFLRTLSVDELPQLFNVIAGDMSLVGPRPLAAEQVTANPGLLAPRHEVRSGLTGWWQINGRSKLSPEEAVELDLFYIENWSFTLDLYILLRTFGVLVRRHDAY